MTLLPATLTGWLLAAADIPLRRPDPVIVILKTVGFLVVAGLAFWLVLKGIVWLLHRRNDRQSAQQSARNDAFLRALAACGFTPGAPDDDLRARFTLRKSLLGRDRLPHDVRCRVVAEPVPGRQMEIFNFAYTLYSDAVRKKIALPTWQTVAIISQEAWHFPHFAVTPHGFVHFVPVQLGAGDIDFDVHPKFSRLFKLQCEDEAAARALFRPEVLEVLEKHPELFVEGLDHSLVFYRRGKVLTAEDVARFQEDVRQIAAQFLAA